jgi:hypothetical protein
MAFLEDTIELLIFAKKIYIYTTGRKLAPTVLLYIISNMLNKTSKNTDKLYIFWK